MTMIHLSDAEKRAKVDAEALMWFRQAQEEHERAENFARRVRAQNDQIANMEAEIASLKKKLSDDAERFEAITTFWHAARASGYNTSWSIGGITAEALREETEHAKKYKTPTRICENDLQAVGTMDKDGTLYQKGVKRKTGTVYEVVFAYRPQPANVKKAKRKGLSATMKY